MGYFKTLREKYSFINWLVQAQKTVWYPVVFAILCIISGTHGSSVYIPILCVLCAFVVFSALFTDDKKVFLTPMLMIYYALGRDTVLSDFRAPGDQPLSAFDPWAFNVIIVCGIIAVGFFLARIIFDGTFIAAFKKKRAFTWGILALDVAFLTNGLFSEGYAPVNLLYGFMMAAVVTVIYFTVCGILDNSDNVITYACQVMVCTAYVALCQILTVIARALADNNFFIPWSEEIIINRNILLLSWGVATIISAVFVLGIPAAMYLARNHRFSGLSYVSAILFFAGAVIMASRSAILVGGAILLGCMAICCISGKNAKKNRLYFAISVLIVVIGLVYVSLYVRPLSEITREILGLLRFDKLSDSGRFPLWKKGIEHFNSSPVFGVGFDKGGYEGDTKFNNMFSNMYHCILVQIPASMGIVGMIAFLIHLLQLLKLMFTKCSVRKLFILLVPVMILGMSLVDNFFFYPNFQIFYCVFLIIAELISEDTTYPSLNKLAAASDTRAFTDKNG